MNRVLSQLLIPSPDNPAASLNFSKDIKDVYESAIKQFDEVNFKHLFATYSGEELSKVSGLTVGRCNYLKIYFNEKSLQSRKINYKNLFLGSTNFDGLTSAEDSEFLRLKEILFSYANIVNRNKKAEENFTNYVTYIKQEFSFNSNRESTFLFYEMNLFLIKLILGSSAVMSCLFANYMNARSICTTSTEDSSKSICVGEHPNWYLWLNGIAALTFITIYALDSFVASYKYGYNEMKDIDSNIVEKFSNIVSLYATLKYPNSWWNRRKIVKAIRLGILRWKLDKSKDIARVIVGLL